MWTCRYISKDENKTVNSELLGPATKTSWKILLKCCFCQSREKQRCYEGFKGKHSFSITGKLTVIEGIHSRKGLTAIKNILLIGNNYNTRFHLKSNKAREWEIYRMKRYSFHHMSHVSLVAFPCYRIRAIQTLLVQQGWSNKNKSLK